jgi:hypothetical protein
MSIVLGLTLELLLVVFATAAGNSTDMRRIAADAAQKVSWSVFICAGLTLGTASARSLRATTMGTLGLITAPAAFLAARMIHRSVTQTLGLEPSVAPSTVIVAMMKAIEYGMLGLVAGWLATKPWAGIWLHALLGLVIGCLFGGALIFYVNATASATPAAAALAGVAVNELIYPAGCAVILYSASTLSVRFSKALR